MSDTNRQIDIFGTESRAAIEAALPAYLPARRWFGGKARTIRSVEIEEAIPFSGDPPRYYLTLIRVSYVEGDPQTYVIPLTFAAGERAEEVRRETPQAVLVEVSGGAEGIIYDTSWDREFTLALLEAIAAGRRFGGDTGEVVAWPMPMEGSGSVNTEGLMDLEPSVVKSEQSNTSVIYGDRYILKLFRRLEAGTSPELEVGRFLAEKRFASTPPLDGAIEYHRQRGEPITMAVLQGFVPNKGDAWRYTLSRLADYFQSNWEAAGGEDLLPRSGHLLATLEEEVPTPVRKAAGSYLEQAALLGRRTAEMHITLASDPSDPAFAPQPFDDDYRRSTYEAMRDLTVDAFELLGDNIDKLQEA
ncbi:MAG: maltokinase N-terminal cap-like domain-containing protein, partial [Chloroflexia bacterium]